MIKNKVQVVGSCFSRIVFQVILCFRAMNIARKLILAILHKPDVVYFKHINLLIIVNIMIKSSHCNMCAKMSVYEIKPVNSISNSLCPVTPCKNIDSGNSMYFIIVIWFK